MKWDEEKGPPMWIHSLVLDFRFRERQITQGFRG